MPEWLRPCGAPNARGAALERLAEAFGGFYAARFDTEPRALAIERLEAAVLAYAAEIATDAGLLVLDRRAAA